MPAADRLAQAATCVSSRRCGVGEHKLEKYGKLFLEVVADMRMVISSWVVVAPEYTLPAISLRH
jgi:hypothetical protein